MATMTVTHSISQQRPRLPQALCKQIHAHRLPKTAESRVLERRLSAFAACHPRALEAARHLLKGLAEKANALGLDLEPTLLFGSFSNYDSSAGLPRFWASGDINPRDVSEALATGNLRELMTMALNASYTVGAAANHSLRPSPDCPTSGAAGMRCPRGGTAGRPARLQTKDRLKSPQFPPLSPREEQHARDFLTMQNGPARMAFERLPTQLGKHRWQPVDSHPWISHAVSLGLQVTAGISATTHQFMAASEWLVGPKNRDAMRLACIAYLVPNHHSFHEVMSAAAWFGCSYEPSVALLQKTLEATKESLAATK